MAIVVQTFVPNASKDQCDIFDAAIEAAMMQRGGPPEGLMVLNARPEGNGFELCNIWRSEEAMRPFYDEVIMPRLKDAGLTPAEQRVSPVWVLARP